jgi:hypothetical protein
MARNQKNFSYQTYVDDNGETWNVRGEEAGAGTGVDGSTAFTPGAPTWGRNTRRRHVRYAIAQDPVTFRTVKFIVYTPTAMGALTPGSTLTVLVPGLATGVGYNISDKIPEKQPIAKASRHLADS